MPFFRKISKFIVFPTLLLTPFFVYAQTISSFFGSFVGIVGNFVPVVVGLGVLFFIFGVGKFILASFTGNEADKESGKKLMIWGIIALFVMISMWGLVAVLNSTFNIGQGIPFIFAP